MSKEQEPTRLFYRSHFEKTLLVLLVFFAFSRSGHALDKIRIGFPDLAAPFVPLAIGDKRGFFREEGLQAEFIRINPAIALQALVSGEIDYYTVLGPGVAAAIRGVPVKLIAAYVPVSPTALIARPEIKSVT
jgi:ABC-type nitrate/sulfonate/bicarbonate transport system substrate-binding protein